MKPDMMSRDNNTSLMVEVVSMSSSGEEVVVTWASSSPPFSRGGPRVKALVPAVLPSFRWCVNDARAYVST